MVEHGRFIGCRFGWRSNSLCIVVVVVVMDVLLALALDGGFVCNTYMHQ